MNKRTSFNTHTYLTAQIAKIAAVVNSSTDRIYIEFGGKVIQDKHSSRVLPGYHENAKLKIIKKICQLGSHGESNTDSVFIVSAADILRGRIRGDFQTTYDQETLRTLTELNKSGVTIRNVAITLMPKGKKIPRIIKKLMNNLDDLQIRTHLFNSVSNYLPQKELFHELSANPFINSDKKIFLVLSPGGGSGKFGVCLNQLYHEMTRNYAPRYLKFETFPVYNLPIDHPINLAYMAASADFYDMVMKDNRRKSTASYNRDLENYELLRYLAKQFPRQGKHLRKITSATSMGINMLTKGILDHQTIQKESAAEIARRLIRYKFEVAAGKEDPRVLDRVRNILAIL